MYTSHEKDVYGWAVHTAQILKDKKMNEVDFDSIIEAHQKQKDHAQECLKE